MYYEQNCEQFNLFCTSFNVYIKLKSVDITWLGQALSMTYDEFRRQLGKAGITSREFAELIKLNPNSITNYARQGEVPSHLAVIVSLMGDMAEHGLDFRVVLSRIEIEPNRSRGASSKGRFGGSKQIDLQLPTV